MEDPKEELIAEMQEVLGLIPSNTRLILNALAHPSLIDYARRYLRAVDKAGRCTKYEYPWSCTKEAEAKFENVKYGWLGGVSEIELDWICENCRNRITEE